VEEEMKLDVVAFVCELNASQYHPLSSVSVIVIV